MERLRLESVKILFSNLKNLITVSHPHFLYLHHIDRLRIKNFYCNNTPLANDTNDIYLSLSYYNNSVAVVALNWLKSLKCWGVASLLAKCQ